METVGDHSKCPKCQPRAEDLPALPVVYKRRILTEKEQLEVIAWDTDKSKDPETGMPVDHESEQYRALNRKYLTMLQMNNEQEIARLNAQELERYRTACMNASAKSRNACEQIANFAKLQGLWRSLMYVRPDGSGRTLMCKLCQHEVKPCSQFNQCLNCTQSLLYGQSLQSCSCTSVLQLACARCNWQYNVNVPCYETDIRSQILAMLRRPAAPQTTQ